MSEIRTHEQVVGIIGILAQEANDDGVNERFDEALRATRRKVDVIYHRRERRFRQEYDLRGPFERAAAQEALAVLTRLADSAYRWAGRDVPPGLVSEIDEAKARLAGVLS